MGPRPFPMKETLKEYLQELKDRAVLDEEAIREEKEDGAKKMEDGAKDIEKDEEVKEKKDDDS